MRISVLWPAGALALAGEAVVHVQQYFALFHEVRWIGPLFLANAVACAAVIAGLAYPADVTSPRWRAWRSPRSRWPA
jgi:hypothetical protein